MSAPDLYYLSLNDETRTLVEQWSYDQYQRTGRKMLIPPALYEDMKKAGVRMNYFEEDPDNEERGLVELMRDAAKGKL